MADYIVVTSTSNTVTVVNQPTNIVVGDSAMRGPTGNTGPQGPQGPQGPAGNTGVIWSTVPASNTSSGTAGQVAYDSTGNLYICVATNLWSKFIGTTSW